MIRECDIRLQGLEFLRIVAWGIVLILVGMIAYVETVHAVDTPSDSARASGSQTTVTHTQHHAITHVR